MEISIAEFLEKDREEFTLIDVREPDEYEEFNLEGKLIPLGELKRRMDELPDSRDAEIIVHCKSGNRSSMACMLIKNEGYYNVKNLTGGVEAYKKHNENG